MSQKRILIIEREKALTEYTGEYLSETAPACTVLGVDSTADGLAALRENSFDLVVSEHEGPGDRDGLQLLKGIREQDVTVRVILLAAPDLAEDQTKALQEGCTSFLVRPIQLEKLAELLLNMLHPLQGFTGRLVGMRLEDVIQMLCYRKDSSVLFVLHKSGRGGIYVDNGGIVHAECDNIVGVEAFYEILGWEGGEFLSQVLLTVPSRTVFMDWQSLLMEGMRQKDEIRHALGPTTVVTPSGAAAAGLYGNGRARRAGDAGSEAAEPAKRIMIVDDSRFIRKIVQEILQSDAGLAVAGYATNGQEALAKIDELKPDLILLDWDMPVMKGSTTLMHIMIRSPCPVVILSGFVGGVGANPFDLLCLGGVDFLRKPQNNWRTDGRADDLVRRIKEACAIKFERIRRVKIPPLVTGQEDRRPTRIGVRYLTVLGAATGGCTDLIRIVPLLREDTPSAVVILHDMQQEAIGAFVDYLNRRSRLEVRSLESGVPLAEGACYLHPSTIPLELRELGGKVSAKILSDLPGSKVLDHFLISASKVMGRNVLAVLLSGGPGKGVEGLRAVKQMEGIAVVQDPMSSVDPRMAEAALHEGIVDYKCLADNLAETIQDQIRQEVTGN